MSNGRKLTIETPHGTFTRTTHRPYTHVAVRETGTANNPAEPSVYATWHLTESAARTPRWPTQVIRGVYPVPTA